MRALLALALQAAVQPPASGRKVSRESLNAMADACRAPRKWLTLRGAEVVFRGPPDGDPVKLACVLKKMSAALDAANHGPAAVQVVKDR